MGILTWIILGGIAGWIASLIMGTSDQQGILMNIVVGIVGAIVGGFVVGFFGGRGVVDFSIGGLLTATLGAIILLSIVRLFNHK